MAFTREDLDQLRHILRPIRTRIANVVARAVVQVIDDAKNMQILQLGVLFDEDGDDCENFQGYGFKSVPLPGAESVAVYPDGDRGVPLVVATEDRRHRPTGWAPGESGLYNDQDAVVRLKEDGTIEAGSAGGAKVALATKADLDAHKAHFDAHKHHQWGYPGGSVDAGTVVSTSAPTTPTGAAPGGTPDPAPTPAGTSKLKGE